MRSNRPPIETFKKPWCRGRYAFGSACGHCDRCSWERGQMQLALAKLAPTRFEQFASERGHDTAPAVLPGPDRVYADRQTQELFETWNAGAATLAKTLMESTFESPAPCELIQNWREAHDRLEAGQCEGHGALSRGVHAPKSILDPRRRGNRPGGRVVMIDMPLTEEWLKEAGFKRHQLERQPDKHWLLWIGDAIGNGFVASYEDLGIEVAPMLKKAEWFWWLRSDSAGLCHRFIHLRHISSTGELIAVIEGITGKKWNVANNLYGSMRSPEHAARIRAEDDRLDRKIMRQTPWSEIEKDQYIGRALPEHREAYEKTKGGHEPRLPLLDGRLHRGDNAHRRHFWHAH